MPRLGGLKLWKLLNDNGVRIGRDELYDILRRRGLLVKRSKSRAITTDSRGWHRQHPNLVKGMDIYTTTGDHTLLSALILLRMYTNKKGMNLKFEFSEKRFFVLSGIPLKTKKRKILKA